MEEEWNAPDRGNGRTEATPCMWPELGDGGEAAGRVSRMETEPPPSICFHEPGPGPPFWLPWWSLGSSAVLVTQGHGLRASGVLLPVPFLFLLT